MTVAISVIIITLAGSNIIVLAVSNIHILGLKVYKSKVGNLKSWMWIGVHIGLVLQLEFVASWRAILWWTQAVPQPLFPMELHAVMFSLPC